MKHLSTSRFIFLLIALLPLISIQSIFNPYEFPKFIVVVATVAIISLLALIKLFQKPEMLGKSVDSLSILVVSFTGVLFLANLLGLDPQTSILGSEYRLQGFILTIALTLLFFLVRTFAQPKNLMKAITISALFVSLSGLLQAVMLHLFNDMSIPTYQGRIVGTMGNPNFLGGYLAMLLPFSLLPLQRIRKRWQIITIVFMVLTILLTESRAAIFASILVLSLFFVRKYIRWQHVGIVLCVIILVILGAIISQLKTAASYDIGKTKLSLDTQARYCLYLLPEAEARKFFFSTLERVPLLLPRTSFCEGRLAIWMAGIQSVSQKPLLGIGQENFELIFPTDQGIKVDNAHNIFLEIAVSSGFLGLFLFLAIIAVGLKRASVTVRLSLLAFLIVAQFNPLSIAQLTLFWTLLGMSVRNSLHNT